MTLSPLQFPLMGPIDVLEYGSIAIAGRFAQVLFFSVSRRESKALSHGMTLFVVQLMPPLCSYSLRLTPTQGQRNALENELHRIRRRLEERTKVAVEEERKATSLARELGAAHTELEAVRKRVGGGIRSWFTVNGGYGAMHGMWCSGVIGCEIFEDTVK